MTEQELLVDSLRRLNRAELTYYLTGSMASNYWGIPRTTHDLDFVIQLAPSAVGEIVAAFSPDYYIEEAAVRAAYQPPHQFNAIDTRSALKVDFWLPKPEPFDREILQRRMRVTLFGRNFSLETSIQLGAFIVLAQAWILIENLLPYRIQTALGRLTTDGLALLQLVTSKSPDVLNSRVGVHVANSNPQTQTRTN